MFRQAKRGGLKDTDAVDLLATVCTHSHACAAVLTSVCCTLYLQAKRGGLKDADAVDLLRSSCIYAKLGLYTTHLHM
jgi:hypothetical protein